MPFSRLKFPRLFGWLVATALLLAFIGFFFPQQLPVSIYKLSLVTLAGVVGYWLDRDLFPYARPDCFIKAEQDDGGGCDAACQMTPKRFSKSGVNDSDLPTAIVFAFAMIRRAIIVGAAMLAMGLGA